MKEAFKSMKSKKLMAVALTATMVVGSSVTALAGDPAPTDANGATGSGETFEHVNKDVISVTFPTTAEVTDVFDYYVDPERLINDAGTLADGSTEVTGNDKGVYFKNSGTSEGTPAVEASVDSYSITVGGTQVTSGLTVTVPTTLTDTSLTYLVAATDGVAADGWYNGNTSTATLVSGVSVKDNTNTDVTPVSGDSITVTAYQAAQPGTATTSYSNSSDAVKFEGKNSVDVEVSVEAEVTASAGGKDIALVADKAALEAAKTPSLLMTLKVGGNEQAITSDGTSASAKITGVPKNFAVTAENNKYVYKIRTNTDEEELDAWDSTTVQLIGETNVADVPAGEDALTAPQIDLTWSVDKSTAPEVKTTPASAVTGSGTTDVLVRLISGVNADVNKITSAKVNGSEVASANIAVSGSGNVWLKGVASAAGTYNILITYDGTVYSATFTK